MKFRITRERAEQYAEINELVKLSFLTSPNADGDEHEYIAKLRSSSNYIPELALVLKCGQNILGQIMLTRTWIIANAGNFEALLLSPVCVHPDYQNQGLGSTIIHYALSKARTMSYKAVFLVGEPSFYKRFGFKPIKVFGLKNAGSIPEQYSLGMELVAGYLAIGSGTIAIS